MSEDEFWGYVALLDENDPDSLVEALSRLASDQIIGFHDTLAKKVSALNTAELRSQVVYEEGVEGEPLQPDTDEFEDLRVAVVAAGRERWEEVISNPSALAGTWSLEQAEDLAMAAEDAYERVTDSPWPTVSLDTLDTEDSHSLPPLSRRGWIDLVPINMLWEGGVYGLADDYYDSLQSIQEQMNDSMDWQRWWLDFRGAESQLVAELMFTKTSKTRLTVRESKDYAGRDEVSVKAVVPTLPSRGRPRDTVPGRAREDTILVIERVATKFNLLLPEDVPHP